MHLDLDLNILRRLDHDMNIDFNFDSYFDSVCVFDLNIDPDFEVHISINHILSIRFTMTLPLSLDAG